MEGFRLSRQQARRWRFQEALGDTVQVTIRGPFDGERLRRAAREWVERHEPLRTLYSRPPGWRQPLQEIHEGAEPPLTMVSPTEARLALPALSADQESLRILAEDLAALHDGRALPEPDLQYADYCGWQEGLEETPAPDLPPPGNFLGTHAGNRTLRERPLELPDDPVQVLAALRLVLWRLNGRVPVAVGVVDAGRREPETRRTVGLFARVLPLVGDLSPETAFAEHVARTTEDLEEARAQTDRLAPDGPALSFQLSWEQAPTDLGGGWTLETPPVDLEPFTLQVAPGVLRHRLDPAWADLLATALATLLEAAGRDPHAPLHTLPLGPLPDLGPLEPGPQVPVWTVLQARDPAAPALEWPGGAWTWGQLAERARAVAAAVRRRVGEGQVVALRGGRSPDLVAAALGILGSGAVLLLLDPAVPEPRAQAMLEEGQAVLEVLARRPGDRCAPPARLPALRVEECPPDPTPLPTDRAGSPACLFFTSGTTGRPRGSLISQAGLARFLAWQGEAFGVGPQDRGALLTGLSFDVVMRDMLLPLLAGGVLCLPPDEVLGQPARLGEWLRRRGITLLHAVPSLAELWLRTGAASPRVRLTFFAGEPLAGGLVERWRRAFPASRVVNLYGPTETTLAQCFHEVGPRPEPGVQPLGRTLPGCQALILSPEGHPCAPGEPGQIALRTPYRALRLLGGASFRPDGAYETGDRGFVDPEGNLRILGRRDQQVKIQGVRVEPAEVEALLRTHPEVQGAAVRAEGEPLRLVAWVVGRSRGLDLAGWLADRLPGALVPARFVEVDSLPLNERGKLDRRALGETPPAEPPATPTERHLARLFQELLGQAPGRDGSFFELGGHSLGVLALVGRLGCPGLELREVFRRPTVRTLAARLEELGWTPPEARPLPRDSHPQLSPAQLRLWLDGRLGGQRPYHYAWALDLRGALDPDRLREAVRSVVARHEVLRTVYPCRCNGLPVPNPTWDLPDLPLVEASPAELETLARGLIEEPFDLERGPIFRARLARLAEDRHVLLCAVHHIAFDAWSRWLFVEDLLAAYAARPVLSGREVQYADYAAWLAGQPEDPEALEWWRRRLEGAPPLSLGPARGDATVRRERRTLAPETAHKLRNLCRERGATLFSLLLAAFQILLARRSGQADVTVGTPLAHRAHPEAERLLGCFLNLVALRANLAGNPPFAEFLSTVQEEALQAFARGHVPFERVVAALAPARDAARHPVIEAVLNLVNVPRRPAALEGLEVSHPDLFPPAARFPLTLYVREEGEGLDLSLVYSGQWLTEADARCLLEQYLYLLERIAESPEEPVDRLPLAPSATCLPLERPAFPTVAETFHRRDPDEPAVRHRGGTLRQGDLAAMVRQLQPRLHQGQRVALTGPCNPGMVAALLAVLGAGGVIVPLDPDLPLERSRRMLDLSGATLLLDATAWPPHEEPLQAAPRSTPPEAAYIAFTSGTTGDPKAILGSHAGLAHFVAWQARQFGVGPGHRVARRTGLSFDVVLREVFLPLTSGALLCLPESAALATPEGLWRWLDGEQVTVLHAVPTLASWWLDHPPASPLAHLRWTFFAGEPLTGELVERWREAAPRSRVVNLYGPTETTLARCWHEVPRPAPPGVQPLGRPLPNSEALVLRGRLHPCAPGELGEIALRTPFASLGSPEGEGHPDVYFTGDLGRLTSDGTLEFAGRADRQLKVRGARLQPEEVEAALEGHPAVKRSRVFLREGRLVAQVWAGAVEPSELRRLLARRLPLPAIPESFEILPDEPPRTANGKLDGRPRPAPPPRPPRSPATPLERLLVDLFRQELGVEPGLDGNFFELGGHSLAAARLLARAGEALGRDLPLAWLFEEQTPEALALRLLAEEAGALPEEDLEGLLAEVEAAPR